MMITIFPSLPLEHIHTNKTLSQVFLPLFTRPRNRKRERQRQRDGEREYSLRHKETDTKLIKKEGVLETSQKKYKHKPKLRRKFRVSRGRIPFLSLLFRCRTTVLYYSFVCALRFFVFWVVVVAASSGRRKMRRRRRRRRRHVDDDDDDDADDDEDFFDDDDKKDGEDSSSSSSAKEEQQRRRRFLRAFWWVDFDEGDVE